MMSWVISVSSQKLARQSPGLTVVGRGMNGGAWRFHAQAPRWQTTAAQHVLAELYASDDSVTKQDKQ
jgi:hypothetical protein